VRTKKVLLSLKKYKKEKVIRMKKEIKKVEKLVNKKGYIPVLNGNEIIFIYNKITGKEYTPKYSLMIGGEL
jgi:hypothetical protein